MDARAGKDAEATGIVGRRDLGGHLLVMSRGSSLLTQAPTDAYRRFVLAD